MATADAVAAVGLTLQTLLADRVPNPVANGNPTPVTLGAPGPERDHDAADDARINLFLYQVEENCFLKNQDIPGHGHRGAFGHPPLSLDLRYLLTVFGSTASGSFFDETPAHQLLGSAMQVFHDNAIITESVVTRRPPAGRLVLDPGLRDEFESIKITLHPLRLEDLSNVWTALELSYRLSVAYQVSVVQIESTRPRRHPRPVQEPPLAGPRVVAVPLQRPFLASIGVRRPGDPPGVERSVPFARIFDTLVLHGDRLSGGGLVVRLGPIDVPVTSISPAGHIEIDIPDDARLRPGTHTVSVATVVPGLPQAAVSSGGIPVVIVPMVSGAAVAGRTLTVTGTRLLDGGAPAQVLVGDTVVERAAYLPASTDTNVQVPLAPTLPAFPAAARVSGPLAPFPAIPGSFDLSVTVGGEGPRVVTLTSTPASLAEAAAAVQAAINGATGAPGFDRVRVTATGQELILVAGDLTTPITVGAGPLATALRLAATSSARSLYLSGALRPFPTLSAAAPQVRARIGPTSADVALGSVPGSVAEAAAALEAGLQAASAAAAFAQARVAVLGDQLCVLPGAPGTVTFGPVPTLDETTVAELELGAAYLVRARVRGVESIDEQTVPLP